ncbi:MAG: hypothetical protein JRH13_15595 [Deltaproteobacteria bacterium]|nr:hypothetical protein [Deltaproteobacteria bacterium]MBW2130773.1 hypothetical protein [Deltaproteobacteria bacterium]
MIHEESLSLKKITLRILLFCFLLAAAYGLFIGCVSLWVGVKHADLDGNWVPILAGSLTMMAVLGLSWGVIRFILSRLKEKDSLEF